MRSGSSAADPAGPNAAHRNMRALIVYNPDAGRRRHEVPIERLRQCLEVAGIEASAVPCDPEHAVLAARLQEAAPADVYVAAGGDGTINVVANALLTAGLASCARLALYPLGSGNDFAANVGAPAHEPDLVAAVRSGRFRAVDAGFARYTTAVGTYGRYFVNSLGLGFEARVPARAARIRWLRGLSRYVAATICELGHVAGQRYRITWRLRHAPADTMAQSCVLVTCSNGARTGGGMRLLPAADTGDGELDFGALFGAARLESLANLVIAAAGWPGAAGRVRRERFTQLAVTSPEPFPLHVDGEYLCGDCRSLEVTLQPAALRVIA